MYVAIKIEIAKKKYNIKMFQEMIAFSEGDSNLEELQKNRNNKSYFKEKIFIGHLTARAFIRSIGECSKKTLLVRPFIFLSAQNISSKE